MKGFTSFLQLLHLWLSNPTQSSQSLFGIHVIWPAYNFFWTEKAKFFFGSFICGGGVYSTNIIILQNFVKGCLAFLLDTTVWKNEKFKHSQYSQYFLKFSVKTAYNFNYVDLT